eukprot:8745934-Alexandrium_andersonii.AAC.1
MPCLPALPKPTCRFACPPDARPAGPQAKANHEKSLRNPSRPPAYQRGRLARPSLHRGSA